MKGGFLFMTNGPTPTPIYISDPAYITRKVYPAGSWALDQPQSNRAVAGNGQRILWAKGESFVICADTGGGKTTFALSAVRASMGLVPDIIGMQVQAFQHILYVAADRPIQIKYALQRLVTEDNRMTWDTRMYIHEGPLDFAVNDKPSLLVPWLRELAEKLDREPFDCLVIDSLKDIVTAMDENDDGLHINTALQAVCREGIQLMLCIHPRKMGQQAKTPVLDDVAGNKMIVSGAGSVVYLGPPSDGLSAFYHLKSPAQKIDGIGIRLDPSTGDVSYINTGLG